MFQVLTERSGADNKWTAAAVTWDGRPTLHVPEDSVCKGSVALSSVKNTTQWSEWAAPGKGSVTWSSVKTTLSGQYVPHQRNGAMFLGEHYWFNQK